MYEELMGGRLIIKTGDLTDEAIDAIVNAANSTLLGGGGVDGAIHRRGGPAIVEECGKIRTYKYPDGLPTGHAVITTAGELPAKYVIHTVGPVYGMNAGRDEELLESCYRASVELAVAHDLQTIAFPSISTGAFGYPKHKAAPIVHRTLAELLDAYAGLEVRLVFFSEADAQRFLRHCC